MTLKLKIIFLLLLISLSSQTIHAEPFKVGRVKLSLPNHGVWTELDSYAGKIDYIGDGVSDGSLPDETKTFALTLPDKQWGAVIILTASKFGTSVEMQWQNRCTAANKERTIDLTNGSFNQADCIRIWDNVYTERLFSDVAYRKAKVFYDSKFVALIGKAYSVTHFFGNSSGTYLEFDILISDQMLSKLKQDRSGNVSDALELFARRLASQSRSSASSLFGGLTLPSFD